MNAQVQTFLHPKQQVKQLIIELSRSITPQQRQVLLDLFIMMDNAHDLFLELDKSHVIIQQCLGAMTKNQLQQMIRGHSQNGLASLWILRTHQRKKLLSRCQRFFIVSKNSKTLS